MSKAKKIISMLLAVAMVLTVAPVSVFSSAAFSPSTVSFTPISFTVDTSATTEVVRVAIDEGSFSLPADGVAGKVVAATPSGIPENGGPYASVGYADETAARPQVVFKITGATPKQAPEIQALPGGLTFDLISTTSADGTTTYVWKIASGSTATAGTDIVYTLTYTVGSVEYKTYAFAHVENILVMNGFVGSGKKKSGESGKYAVRLSHIVQFQSKNMYAGRADNTVDSNRVLGYINYATVNPLNGNELYGCGSSTDLNSSVNAFGSAAPNDAIAGVEAYALIKSVRSESETTRKNLCYANDQNRGESLIYIDKRNESDLGPNGINLRMTLQNGDRGNYENDQYEFQWGGIENLIFQTGHVVFEEETGSWDVTANTSEITYESGDVVPYDTWNSSKSGNVISTHFGSVIANFKGTGPTAITYNDSEHQYSVVVDLWATNPANSHVARTAGGMNLDFKVYDTTDLYNLYHGIVRGSGTYTCVTDSYVGAEIAFDNGSNPQSSMYTSGWSDFLTAFKAAGSVLAKPDTNQEEIDAVALDLYNKYNALEGYHPTVNYEIRHVYDHDNDATTANIVVPGTTSVTGTKDAGYTMQVTPGTITGYNVVDTSVRTETLDGSKENVVVDILYAPATYRLRLHTNTDLGIVSSSIATGTAVKLADLDHGTKQYFTFAGWYKDAAFATAATDFSMGTEEVNLYAKWTPTPITIECVPVVDGAELTDKIINFSVTPDADPTKIVEFDRPADSEVEIEGYLFVQLYADKELTTLVDWPLEFKLGDAGTKIYARMVNVENKISFETNGGTPVDDINFTAPATINQPEEIPAKEGYTFEMWYYDKALTQPITWPVEMNSSTGFIAYAGYTANDITISFDVGKVSTKYDTKSVDSITAPADSLIDKDFYPVDPLKFGYTFAGWSLSGAEYEFDGTNTMPTKDILLTAEWTKSDYSAFVDIESYEKLSGDYVETTTASAGDVVTFRMSSLTNFYTGSTVFVFMYDTSFFELVDDGTDAFVVNTNNEYVSGINAKIHGITDDSMLSWPSGVAKTETKADGTTAQYAAMMITIDPTVTLDESSFNCEPMSDGEWLVEFQLKVKADATGSGKVFMDNAWTRSIDNPSGLMFYGWGSTNTPTIKYNSDGTVKSITDFVGDTQNNVVLPNLVEATATITLDETAPQQTTVNLEANGGAWGNATTKIYTGSAETEIMDYAAPTRVGYTQLKDDDGKTVWYKKVDDTTVDESVRWVEGYYAKADETDFTFVAQWTPNLYTINFYTDDEGLDLYSSIKIGYETLISEKAPEDPTLTGYVFAGWVDAEGNKYDLATATCPLDGVDLYATWEPATDTKFVVKATAINPANGSEVYTSVNQTGTTGYEVHIVETVPANPAENTIYITLNDLPSLRNGNYVYDPDNNTLPIKGTIAPDGSTVITVNYIGKDVTFTYDADGGVFANGSSKFEETKTYNNVAQGPGTTDSEGVFTAEEPTKYGYTFGGWSGVTLGTDRMTANKTYKATWTPVSCVATFNAVNGELAGTFTDGTATMTSNINFGETITAPDTPSILGYTFLGWATSEGGAVEESLGTMDDVNGKVFYAVYELTEYSIDYYVDGEYAYSDTATMGQTITLRDKPTKTGYTFNGWKLDGTVVTAVTMGTADVTVEGDFEANSYDVIFDATGGFFDGDTAATTKAVSTKFDAAINPPDTDPVRNGYKFLGWAASKESDVVVSNYGTLTTIDTVTFYALWEATFAEYTIEIYKMAIGGASYDLYKTETRSDLVEKVVEYTPEAITGFTLDTENSTLSGTVDADNPLVLVVKYTRDQYTLTTNVDGVKSDVATYYYEEVITEPERPSKTGYTCSGWSNLPADMKMVADTEIVAQWTANKYQITFYNDINDYNNSANAIYDMSLDYDSEYNVPTPSKTGHTFANWVNAETGEKVTLSAIEKVTTAKDVVYYAEWTVDNIPLVYRAAGGKFEGGAAQVTYQIPYGTARADWTKPADPTRAGYYFTEWDYSSAPATMGTSQVDLTAKWAKETYKVIWNIDGVEISADYNMGDTIVVPDATQTAKEGYTFTGWSDTPMETMEDIGDNGETITYVAQYDINQYTITFNTDGGTAVEKITLDYDKEITADMTTTKIGYTFDEWIWTKESDGSAVAAPTKMPAYNVVATATWTINKYDVEWVIDGETYDTYEGVEYGTEIVAPAPTKTGYVLSDWAGYTDGMTMPDGPLTFTATWDPATDTKYTVEIHTMNADGSYTTETKELKGTTDSPVNADEYAVVETGFELGANSVTNGVVAADGSLVLKVYLDRIVYKLSTDVDGDVKEVAEYRFGAEVAEPAAPANKEGHTFTAWEGYTEGMTMPADDVVLKATWDVNDYTVTWDVDGAKTPETYAYNADITLPEEPTKEGHTFDAWAWTKDEDGSAVAAPSKMPAYNATAKATWTVNSYQVIWVVDETQTPEEYDYKEQIVAPTDPTKEGYTFTGWKDSDGNSYAVGATMPTMPAKELTFTAQWQINSYTVTWIIDGVTTTETVEYNATITVKDDPNKEYYTFEGWSWSKTEGGDAIEAQAKMPAYDVTVEAIFERVPVTLKLIADTAVIDTNGAEDPVSGYIYGLETKLNETKLREKYLSVEGDGKLIITLTKFNVCGTGTKVEVYDNVENKVVETYYIIIFGDVNGDAVISAIDTSMIGSETVNTTSWSVEGEADYDYCKVMAADLNGSAADETVTTKGDGKVNGQDRMALVDVTLYMAEVDQETGEVIYY